MTDKHIPWARPDFWGKEQGYVVDALASTWISGGHYVDKLEKDIARWTGAANAFAVSNGTTALHLAYLAMGLKPGDEVIVPAFCFQAAANIALHMGAKPVFADVEPDTWCTNASLVEKCLSARTRAVVPVHTYGNACAMDPIMALCRQKGITVIEDNAEALGTRYQGRYLGAIGDLGTLSFQATKTITTGEGGMVLTSNDRFIKPLALYRSHGVSDRRYWHEVAGHNFRLPNVLAALGCAQFEQIESIIAARRRMHQTYKALLDGQRGVRLQAFGVSVDAVLWAFSVRLDPAVFPQGRDAVIRQMRENDIETRNGFCSPVDMRHLYGIVKDVPVSRDLSDNVISLPSYPTLQAADMERICSTLLKLRK